MSEPIKVDESRILSLPLAEVYVPHDWNVRSGIGASSSGGADDENTDEGLYNSIKARGQDEPILVRTSEGVKGADGKQVRQPYTIVQGYRRLWAIGRIAEEAGTVKTATVKARAKRMSEVDARLANLRENTARDNLSPSDLCFGIQQALALEPAKTANAMADELGLTIQYISRFYEIIDKVKPALLKRWREMTGKKLTVSEMYALSKLDKKEQDEAFGKYCAKKQPLSESDTTKKWIENEKAKNAKLGTLLAKLAKAELIDLDPETFFVNGLEIYGKVAGGRSGDEVSERVKSAMADAGYRAFMLEYEREDEAEGPTAEEVKAEKASKKSKNGAVAQA